MDPSIMLENIDRMRRMAGIDDRELRNEILELKIGDLVRVTFLNTLAEGGETLLVRITSIRGQTFRGRLVQDTKLKGIHLGKLIVFSSAHIHSTSHKN